DGDLNDATDQSIINNANALGRYQMAAFLVSQYNFAAQGNASNNGIQEAIWMILDPSSAPAFAAIGNPSEALEAAATWLNCTSAPLGVRFATASAPSPLLPSCPPRNSSAFDRYEKR